MGGQLGFQHLFERICKQAREDAVLAKEIVQALCAGQFLLHTLN
jgi:hypothetical protein